MYISLNLLYARVYEQINLELIFPLILCPIPPNQYLLEQQIEKNIVKLVLFFEEEAEVSKLVKMST